jgi:LPXTG-motif cell wall-anchored protein
MRLPFIILFLLLTLTSRADIIGMIKPNVVYDKKGNGKTIEMKVEYEVWNYWHTLSGHKWTEVYHFNQSGILTLSYGDGDWAGASKKYWKHKYQVLDSKRLKDYYYDYGSNTTTYPESKGFLSYIDTVEINNEFNKVTLEKLKSYINEHTKAFESRGKMFSGENKIAEKAFEAIANELLDKLNKKEEPKPEPSYTWLYITIGALIISILGFIVIKKRKKHYSS